MDSGHPDLSTSSRESKLSPTSVGSGKAMQSLAHFCLFLEMCSLGYVTLSLLKFLAKVH